jgi:hypothetical protein
LIGNIKVFGAGRVIMEKIMALVGSSELPKIQRSYF